MGEWHKTGVVCAALVVAGWAGLYGLQVRTDGETPLLMRSAATVVQLVPCGQAALMFHDVRWAAACMALAEQDALGHAACLQIRR